MPKRIIRSVDFSADYDTASPESATFVNVPNGKLLAENSSPFGSEMLSAELLGGGEVEAAADGSASYSIRKEAGTDSLAAIRTALKEPAETVYVRENYADGTSLLFGPCYGGFSIPSSGRGTFLMEVVNLTAPAASTDDLVTLTPAA